jgi:hypothetical protein
MHLYSAVGQEDVITPDGVATGEPAELFANAVPRKLTFALVR